MRTPAPIHGGLISNIKHSGKRKGLLTELMAQKAVTQQKITTYTHDQAEKEKELASKIELRRAVFEKEKAAGNEREDIIIKISAEILSYLQSKGFDNYTAKEFNEATDAMRLTITGNLQHLVRKKISDKLLKDGILKNMEMLSKQLEESDFTRFAQHFQIYPHISEPTLSGLQFGLEFIEKEITNYTNLVIEAYELQRQTELLRMTDTYEENNKKIAELETEIASLTSKINNYEQSILNQLGVSISTLSKSDIDELFRKKIEEKNNEKKITDEKITQYEIISNLKKDSEKLLEFESLTRKIKEQSISIQNRITINIQIESETNSLTNYLEKRINSYFNIELINQLYSKVEPHPEYKNISFMSDFINPDNPKLQIYAKDSLGSPNVPVLEFSSGQVNILSICIFLANALTVKDEDNRSIDCIFIDDPVQSMDSINMLSIIDLFRSISLNLNKQLIVSTHEPNFFSLLQRKIPKTYFRSKFIPF